MKILIISACVLFFAATDGPDRLKGRWQSQVSPAGNVTSIYFPGDTSFEGFVNRKPFVSGTFTATDSIFSFVDNGCSGMRGVYRMIFFSNDDSLRFVPIADSCEQRKAGMSRLIVGRVRN